VASLDELEGPHQETPHLDQYVGVVLSQEEVKQLVFEDVEDFFDGGVDIL
jgi:hypothetical protein